MLTSTHDGQFTIKSHTLDKKVESSVERLGAQLAKGVPDGGGRRFPEVRSYTRDIRHRLVGTLASDQEENFAETW